MTWLGAQEALYAGLLWHLEVPQGYTEQVPASGVQGPRVFPGRSYVNVGAGAGDPSIGRVNIAGHVGAWLTDMEQATSCKPRLYGFDFSRVTGVCEISGAKRLVVEKDQQFRRTYTGLPYECAMMKDLMLSSWDAGGEVCMSYHMFNPYLPRINHELFGYDTGNALSHQQGAVGNLGTYPRDLTRDKDLGQVDIINDPAPEIVLACQLVERNAIDLGSFVSDVLSHPLSGNKPIYIRLYHEPNARFFWWGEPEGTAANTQAYYENYAKLWNFTVDTIKDQVAPALHNRLVFVFSINGEEHTSDLVSKLNGYLPSNTTNSDLLDFRNNIGLIGLDYYEDWAKDPALSNLDMQYAAVKAKALDPAIVKEHALTEVSIRTKFLGKLYDKWHDHEGNIPAWPVANRTFFDDAVFQLVRTHDPKWVLFWVNRVGNSSLDSFTPTTAGTNNSVTPLFYGSQTNVFTERYAEHYFPVAPNEAFYIETYLSGSIGAPGFFKIPAPDVQSFSYLPGAVSQYMCIRFINSHGVAYRDAVEDFFKLVPQYKLSYNATKITEIDAYINQGPIQRLRNWLRPCLRRCRF